ncbi:hypothetical protein J2X11_000278 [Aeromicrobium panaciterrae]|uniref:Peptidase S55 domain-containing protein n=1 Tax=Aeromicrobium panaciterrae TaxID=363861 RepID=A0ABU1UJT5_9ACTN|nr:hypothetical protein [Aeromicrobium panaciterrae]MDR7085439.1 hypothetical protein [Aeromicrobium panaciterrae]
MTTRPLHAFASLTAVSALVVGGLAATATASYSAIGDNCPDAYDTSTLAPGQPVTGLTTVEGTTPEEFHGVYLRTIQNGIGPGMDLPVFKMEDSRITKSDGSIDAGIWAGMSGSPVYDDATGDLIGAVSYGFSNSPSDIAGVTPATYMYDLKNPKYNAATAAPAPASKSAIASLQSASEGEASLGQPRMLRPKKQVSGAPADIANKQAKRSPSLQSKSSYKKSGFVDAIGQSSAPVNYPIVVGGNLATTFSYGEVTTAAVGTVTAICAGKVIGFGHPDEFSGKSNETFHGASTVTIQPDAFGSYKLANVGTVKGVINQDRLQGILGTIGQSHSPINVHSTSTGLGDTKESTTKVSVPFALSYVVATQVAGDAIAVLNQYGAGESLMTWTITYTREGTPFPQTFERTQRYSTSQYFPEDVAYEAASDVEALLSNQFEKVKITDVEIESELSPDYRKYKIASAQYKSGATWKTVENGGVIKTKRGATVDLRLKLKAPVDSDAAPENLDFAWKMSTRATKSGTLNLAGQSFDDYYDEEFGEEFVDEEEGDVYEPESLDELLDLLLTQPRQDDLTAYLRYRKLGGGVGESFREIRAPGIVSGNYTIRFAYKK